MSSARAVKDVWIPVRPIVKERARVVELPNGKKTAFTPKRTKQFETDVRWCLKGKQVRPIKQECLEVTATFHLPSLKAKRGDLDNYVKSLFDACNEYAWDDDKQVTALHAFLRQAGPDGPGITFSVKTDEEANREN